MTRKTIGIFGGVVVVALFAVLTVGAQRPPSQPVPVAPVEEQLTRNVAFEPTVIVGQSTGAEVREVEFEPVVITLPARHARLQTHRIAASIQ